MALLLMSFDSLTVNPCNQNQNMQKYRFITTKTIISIIPKLIPGTKIFGKEHSWQCETDFISVLSVSPVFGLFEFQNTKEIQ
jgi:hypothetical protein